MYQIEYSKKALKSIAKFKKSNPRDFKKLKSLIEELHEHPRIGTGHPEPLINGNDVTYSRRINKSDRLIYNVYENVVTVLVVSVEQHYNDK